MLSSKSPSPAWEEISEVGPEPEADTGFDKIHASRQGNAADQCCLPHWLALALHAPRTFSVSPTVWKSIPHKYCRDSPNPDYIPQLPSDIAGMKRGRHAKTWSVCNAHRRLPCFPANKNKLAGNKLKIITIRVTKTNTVISDYNQPFFTNISVKKPLNFLQGKIVHLAKDGAVKGVGGVCVHKWSLDRLLRGG